MLDESDQPPVVDGVEEPTDIRIEHPVHLLSLDAGGQGIERIVRSTSGPKAVGEAEEVAFLDRVHHRNHS
jgi:hypothetical protein